MMVYLPIATAPTDAPSSRTGNPIVLVADDEPSLRRLPTLILTTAGFDTLEARDGAQAVELVRARSDISRRPCSTQRCRSWEEPRRRA